MVYLDPIVVVFCIFCACTCNTVVETFKQPIANYELHVYSILIPVVSRLLYMYVQSHAESDSQQSRNVQTNCGQLKLNGHTEWF